MENKLDYITARILNGEASSEDVLTLSEWLNNDEKNKKEFSMLKGYWDAEVSFEQNISSSISLEKIKKEVRHLELKRKNRLFLLTFLPTAVAVALLLFAGILLYTRTPERQNSEQLYTCLSDKNRTNITLQDGTKVILNKHSRLTYSNAYGKTRRVVQLDGEAYFEVTKDVQSPFIVEVGDASINVLGTIFNVKADCRSDEIKTILLEGSIRFESNGQKVVLIPNQQLTFSRATGQLDVQTVDSEEETAWKEGLLKYHTTSFELLVRDLEKVYNVPIIISNEQLKEPSFTVTGTFSQEQSLEEILQIITRSLPIRWTVKNSVYYID